MVELVWSTLKPNFETKIKNFLVHIYYGNIEQSNDFVYVSWYAVTNFVKFEAKRDIYVTNCMVFLFDSSARRLGYP